MFSFLNPYVLLGGLVALIAVGGGGYLKGRSDCSAKYQYAAIMAERDELRLNAQVTETIRNLDSQKMTQDAERIRDLQEKADSHATKLSDPDGVCFGNDDADRVRDLFRHKAP